MANPLPDDVPNLTFIIEARVHDQLIAFEAADDNLRVARNVLNLARKRFFGRGALLFAEENRIPIVTQRDVEFVEDWGPIFDWNGVAFYPEPNNINVVDGLELDEINALAANHVDLWIQAGEHEETIQRAHNRLQEFEDALEPFADAIDALVEPSEAHEAAAAPLVKATIIPVVTARHLRLVRVLKNQFGWTGNAMYPRSNDIRMFYGVLTQAEGDAEEDVVAGRANNMHFRNFVHR